MEKDAFSKPSAVLKAEQAVKEGRERSNSVETAEEESWPQVLFKAIHAMLPLQKFSNAGHPNGRNLSYADFKTAPIHQEKCCIVLRYCKSKFQKVWSPKEIARHNSAVLLKLRMYTQIGRKLASTTLCNQYKQVPQLWRQKLIPHKICKNAEPKVFFPFVQKYEKTGASITSVTYLQMCDL